MAIRYGGSRSYYEHNYRAFGNEVLQSSFMRNSMRARGTAVLAAAQQMAPVDSGEYAQSFELTDGIRQIGRTRRAYARVTNTAPHAMAVEFGWGATPRYRVLGRALGVVPGDQVAGA